MHTAEIHAPATNTRRFYWVGSLLVLLLGLALRLYRLDWQSLWYDEVFSVTLSHLSWPAMHAELIKDVVHPPLHYYVLHLWMVLFGQGEFQARLLSVVFGTLSIGAIYLLARYLFDERAALVSALLLAVSQTAIHYSQEARTYAQLLFLTLCCSYLFIRALRSGDAGRWWLFVASTILLLYTHYYSLFVFAVFVVFGFLMRAKYAVPFVRWAGFIGALALALGAWMAGGVLREALHGGKVSLVPSSEHWYTFITVLNIFNNGRVNGFPNAAPWWSFPIGFALLTVPAANAVVGSIAGGGEQRAKESTLFLVLLGVLPIAFALAMGLVIPFFDIRYVGFCAAPYYILVARGLTSLHSRTMFAGMLAAGLAFSTYGLRSNYFLPYKENHRDSLSYIAKHSQPGDCYVAVPPWEERQVRWAWAIYNPSLPELVAMPAEAIPSSSCGRIWLISVAYMNIANAFQRTREAQELLAGDYLQVQKQSYFWVETALYERKGAELGRR